MPESPDQHEESPSLSTDVPIIILASASWETQTPVNVHQIAKRFAQRGHRVLFVESTGLRAPSLSRGRDVSRVRERFRGWRAGPRAVDDNLWVFSPMTLPMRGPKPLRSASMRAVGGAINRAARSLGLANPILWCFLPTYLLAAPRIVHRRLVYHCVDHYAANPGVDRPWIEIIEKRMLVKADLVIATSGVLAERLRLDRSEVVCLSNVADVDLFSKAATDALPEPEDLRPIPHPRLIYVGNLAQYRIDIELLDTLLDMKPDAHLILIGVIGHGDVTSDSSVLKQLLDRSNVHPIEAKPQDVLPAYLKHADVALIPFLDNEHTRGSLPLKFWEYMASGLPIVATDLPNLREAAGDALVHLATTREAWLEAIEAARQEPSDAAKRRIQAATAHGWPARIEDLSRLLSGIDRTPLTPRD